MLRKLGSRLLAAVLWVFYLVGFLAGAVIVAAVTVGGAVRLGWSDVKRRGEHGAA
jgi:hypothetical protein